MAERKSPFGSLNTTKMPPSISSPLPTMVRGWKRNIFQDFSNGSIGLIRGARASRGAPVLVWPSLKMPYSVSKGIFRPARAREVDWNLSFHYLNRDWETGRLGDGASGWRETGNVEISEIGIGVFRLINFRLFLFLYD